VVPGEELPTLASLCAPYNRPNPAHPCPTDIGIG